MNSKPVNKKAKLAKAASIKRMRANAALAPKPKGRPPKPKEKPLKKLNLQLNECMQLLLKSI